MNDLFAAFGGWQNLLVAAIVGTVTYFLSKENLTWAIVAGVIALVVLAASKKDA